MTSIPISWFWNVKTYPRDFHQYINSQKYPMYSLKKDEPGIRVAQSDFEKTDDINGQFTDVFTKTEHNQVPHLDRSAPFM